MNRCKQQSCMILENNVMVNLCYVQLCESLTLLIVQYRESQGKFEKLVYGSLPHVLRYCHKSVMFSPKPARHKLCLAAVTSRTPVLIQDTALRIINAQCQTHIWMEASVHSLLSFCPHMYVLSESAWIQMKQSSTTRNCGR